MIAVKNERRTRDVCTGCGELADDPTPLELHFVQKFTSLEIFQSKKQARPPRFCGWAAGTRDQSPTLSCPKDSLFSAMGNETVLESVQVFGRKVSRRCGAMAAPFCIKG